MANNKRDDFSAKTIRTLQERAGCRCSMPGCGAVTIGPSEESSEKSINLGVAAHICAAAPKGKRYDPNMTTEERRHIENGIWLCVLHSVLIDRDVISYPVEVLHAMKIAHEEAIKLENRSGQGFLQLSDFIAIGPDIVGLGELLGSTGNSWSIRIDHFVTGDILKLISFIESYEEQEFLDRYLIINALGDGRQLAAAPSWRKDGKSIELKCIVKNRFPRKNVNNLGSTLATNASNDIYFINGNLAVVSGIKALPQKIRTTLSLIQGESPFFPKAGTRLKEYFDEFEDSPWLLRWIKLEVIRQSCIPLYDKINNTESTPLECVTKVIDVVPISNTKKGNWCEIKFKLEVEGIGIWEEILSICVPKGDIPPKPKGWELLAIK
ncbi:hypothetical protein QVN82_10980 [Yersinia enterocolitica]|uniref:hypothetical protein n=1 Tax=Yersinia enterocolitica TaxID=630 RepID=UPI0005E3E377|nr:hypothetical protein [Yersinia enterocolitica]MDN0099159.1 hypothetical protein [Yersinia enterocolitica]CQJ36213.1 Uncharacterised protein [Yersinia enterocolitica]